MADPSTTKRLTTDFLSFSITLKEVNCLREEMFELLGHHKS